MRGGANWLEWRPDLPPTERNIQKRRIPELQMVIKQEWEMIPFSVLEYRICNHSILPLFTFCTTSQRVCTCHIRLLWVSSTWQMGVKCVPVGADAQTQVSSGKSWSPPKIKQVCHCWKWLDLNNGTVTVSQSVQRLFCWHGWRVAGTFNKFIRNYSQLEWT